MSLFFEKRAVTWEDVPWGPSTSWQGSPQALRIVSCYAAVSLYADLFSTLPQHLYRGEGSDRLPINPPPWLRRPDSRLSLTAWRYQYSTSLKLRGNAYGLVLGSYTNPAGIRWLHPDSVHVDESDPTGPRYHVAGRREPLTLRAQGGELVHVQEFVQPGSVVGLSPIANFKQVFETAGYALNYGHDWFENSAVPDSLLMAKKQLKPGQAGEAKKLFRESLRDGGPVTLDSEWDYKQLTIAPNEAQFLETIKASATLIATIFRVPAEDVGGEVGSSRSYGNREADAERFNVRGLLPHVVRFESAMNEVLPQPQYLKLSMDGLTRPNLLERSRANTENLRNGSITLPEVRAQLDRPMLTPEEIEFWQQNYNTNKSEAESISQAISESITKEA